MLLALHAAYAMEWPLQPHAGTDGLTRLALGSVRARLQGQTGDSKLAFCLRSKGELTVSESAGVMIKRPALVRFKAGRRSPHGFSRAEASRKEVRRGKAGSADQAEQLNCV